MSRPHTDLLMQENSKWNAEADAAFQKLKDVMIIVHVLVALPNFKQPFVLETNVSGKGLGSVLMQNQKSLYHT